MNTEQYEILYKKALKDKDFKTFAAFCSIYSEEKGMMRFQYDHWNNAQRQFEKNRTGFDIVLKPRRIGFTTLELVRDLFYAIANPGSEVVIVTNSEPLTKQSLRIIKNIIQSIQDMEKKLGFRMLPDITSSNLSEIIFSTNSRIYSVTAKNSEDAAESNGRGFTISRLHATEVAFWAYPDLTMQSLLNAAKHAKEIVIESTPNGASGYFFETYFKAKNGEMPKQWKSHFFPWFKLNENRIAFDNKKERNDFVATPKNNYEKILIEEHNIQIEQLNWWRQTVKLSAKGIDYVAQEYPIDDISCFRIQSNTLFEQEDFEYLESSHKPAIIKQKIGSDVDNDLHIWIEPNSNRNYILGADTSYGRGKDSSCLYVIDRISGEICARYSSDKIKSGEFGKIIVQVAKKYNNAYVGIEAQATGEAVVNSVINEGYYNLYKDPKKDYYGWNTSSTSRVSMFNLFQQIIKDQTPTIIDYQIVSECKTLLLKDNNKIEHSRQGHDDHIMAYLIAQKIREEFPQMMSTGYVSVRSSKVGNLGFRNAGSTYSRGFSLR